MGAGFATAMGSVFSLLMMLAHFGSRRNTIRLEKPEKLFSKLKTISITGCGRGRGNLVCHAAYGTDCCIPAGWQ